ncbi:hypothetical protein ACMU_18985 [Actibacterium mucosum KCTC 23349]|uniref:ABC transporter domain-containing protein n=1 Tax=Actibacterium mucosum KCTC 23349 TaxID=1454373 RepID=A0A037ZCT5_9RHOB|nr:sn-glycerol-3-phosphate ABC transporter ATP-binding protein UgpC [Actibacterium mucosum]KAJ54309.1 hypothetical protein ACMU_18985 [Actibacterium mucosum KCTC 23349]
MAELELIALNKSFGPTEVIRDVNVTAKDGEFVVLVGPSGCGKSTLLRLIAGLEKVSDGTILIDGQDVTHDSDRDLAMVFQSYALYPHMTVAENMSFALENMKIAKDEIQRRVAEAAKLLQIDMLLDRRPKALSGGQRQRVAIGRAIVRDPKIFLFDEPLSNLDAELRVSMRKELARLHAKIGGTMIYVTHDQVEAMTLADRIVVLRAGRVEQIGTPMDLYLNPVNKFVAGFIGSPMMNFLPVTTSGTGLELPDTSTFQPPENIDVSKVTEVGIRPDHLTLTTAGAGLMDIRVTLTEELGGETYIYGETPGVDELRVRLPGIRKVARGDLVGVETAAEHLHFFDGDIALPRNG